MSTSLLCELYSNHKIGSALIGMLDKAVELKIKGHVLKKKDYLYIYKR